MGKTTIGWVDFSLNFYSWNCIKVSEGCRFCYAEAMASRNGKHFNGLPSWREAAVDELRRIPAGASVFVNDMSDTFIEGVSGEWVSRIFTLMRQRPDVQFQVLTKRIERSAIFQNEFGSNIWLGTSIENRKRLYRLETLKALDVPHKFVSVEPLLEALGDVDWSGVEQVIVGGESGGDRRPFNHQWAREIRDECARDGVAFYFKQGSEYRPGLDRLLDGRTHDDLAWRVEPDETDFQQQQSLF